MRVCVCVSQNSHMNIKSEFNFRFAYLWWADIIIIDISCNRRIIRLKHCYNINLYWLTYTCWPNWRYSLLFCAAGSTLYRIFFFFSFYLLLSCSLARLLACVLCRSLNHFTMIRLDTKQAMNCLSMQFGLFLATEHLKKIVLFLISNAKKTTEVQIKELKAYKIYR